MIYFCNEISRCVRPSYACEEHAQGVAAKLGAVDAALQRFVESEEGGESQGGRGPRFPPARSDYAAGSIDNPIMMSQVQVGAPLGLLCGLVTAGDASSLPNGQLG